MILIGLGHKARQGKDFISNYMKEALSGIRTYSFAKALKEHCRDNHATLVGDFRTSTGFTGQIEQKDDPIYGHTRILQWYGTLARQTDPDVWIKKVAAQIEIDNPEIAIVTDVRFPNEAAYIKENDGYTVECIRRQADGSQYTDPGRDPNHISETALNDYNFDFIISVMNGDLVSLRAKAEGVLRDILREEARKEVGDFEFDTTEEGFGDLEELPLPDATGFPQ